MSDTVKKTKSKKVKTPTVINAKELKAWLRGIQEFQPDGWVPSVEQWDAIRERIFLLEEVEAYAEAPQHQSYAYEVVPQRHYAPEPAYTAVTPAYAAVPHEGALSATVQPGKLATSRSPTESGMVPVTSADQVLEGEYKSPF